MNKQTFLICMFIISMSLFLALNAVNSYASADSTKNIVSNAANTSDPSYPDPYVNKDIDRKVKKEIGAWALAKVANHLKISTDAEKIIGSISWNSDRGASMYDLSEAAKKLGLKPFARRLNYNLLLQHELPLIVYFPSHIAVLTKVDKDKGILTFEEYSKDTYTLSKEDLEKEWEGYVLEIRK